jgi:hypothetical protein
MSTPHAAAAGLQLVVVTGLSGAGRSTAAKCLEDLGWFVVDNLPPSLLPTMVDLGSRSQGAVGRIAVVVDVRSRAFTSDLETSLADIERHGVHPRVLFLEASDDALVRRFESVRRPHPLQGDGRLVDGILRERELLRDLRGAADLVLDTSLLNVHELRGKVVAAFGELDASTPCRSPCCRSATSTACRSTPTWWSTAGSSRTRTGCPSCGRAPAATRGPRLRPGAAGRDRVPGPLRVGPRARGRRLPPRGQAVRAAGRRVHRRQAPQRGDERAARAAPQDPRPRRLRRPPRPGARVTRATRRRAVVALGAATASRRRCRPCGG